MTKWETDKKDRRKRHGGGEKAVGGGEGKGEEDKERMATVAVEQFRTRPVRRSDKRDKKGKETKLGCESRRVSREQERERAQQERRRAERR